jgi:cytoskeletal protein RodZ
MGIDKNVMSRKAKNGISVMKGVCLALSGIGVGWLIGLSVSPVIYIVITSLIAFIVSVTSALAGLKLDEAENNSSDQPNRKHKLQVEINPLPMTLMIVGLAVGASVGIYARTNNWLGPRPANFAARWKDTELSNKEISRRLFDELYPASPQNATVDTKSSPPNSNSSQSPPASSDTPSGKKEEQNSQTPETANKKPQSESAGDVQLAQKSLSPVLFTATVDECASLRSATDEDLKNQLTHLSGSSTGAERVRQEAKACPNVECLKKLVQKICQKPRSK